MVTRSMMTVAGALGLLVVGCSASPERTMGPNGTALGRGEAEQSPDVRIERRLAERVSATFRKGQTLTEVIHRLRELMGANIVLTAEAMQVCSSGTKPSPPRLEREIRLKDVPLSTVLDVVLDQFMLIRYQLHSPVDRSGRVRRRSQSDRIAQTAHRLLVQHHVGGGVNQAHKRTGRHRVGGNCGVCGVGRRADPADYYRDRHHVVYERLGRSIDSLLEIWIDKKTFMPLKVVTIGHDGKLAEQFEYHNLKLNVGLTAKDFDPNNKEYDF